MKLQIKAVLLIAIALFYHSCRKDRIAEDFEHTESPAQIDPSASDNWSELKTQFLDVHYVSANHPLINLKSTNRTGLHPFIEEVRDFLADQDVEDELLNEITNLAGYPVWDYGQAANMSEGRSIAIIPYLGLSDDVVNYVMVGYRGDDGIQLKLWSRSFMEAFNIATDIKLGEIKANNIGYYDYFNETIFSATVKDSLDKASSRCCEDEQESHYFLGEDGLCWYHSVTATFSYYITVDQSFCDGLSNSNNSGSGGTNIFAQSGGSRDALSFSNWLNRTFFPIPGYGQVGGSQNNIPPVGNNEIVWSMVNDLRYDLATTEFAISMDQLDDCEDTGASSQEKFQFLIALLSNRLQGSFPNAAFELGNISEQLESFNNDQFMDAASDLIGSFLSSLDEGDYNQALDEITNFSSLVDPCEKMTTYYDGLQSIIQNEGLDLTVEELSQLVSVECLNQTETSFVDCATEQLFDDNFELEVAEDKVIDLRKVIEDCFGVEDENTGEFVTCSNAANHHFTVTLYVDQPNPNSRDTYSGYFPPDVGHTFVSLSSSGNGTTNTVVFGLYPEQTIVKPSSPVSPPAIQDNGGYDYSVSLTYTVDCGRFNSLLSQAISLSSGNYNLNDFNCTDYGIQVINSSIGSSIPDTQGSWPGGSGSNPGDLGEDLRGMTDGVLDLDGGTAPSTNCN